MVVLGIDPGFATVGYGVVRCENGIFTPISYGAITTPPHTLIEKRLKEIYDCMCQLIDTYKPDCMAVEELFWNTNQTTGIRVSEARGVILLAGAERKIPIHEYTPLQVKQAVVGYGRADKKQVITMVTMLLNLAKPPKPDDTADALAVAICHGHSGASRLAGYYNK